MKRQGDTLVVGKNRWRAFWALLMIALALPVSGWFVYLGLRSGRPDVGWMMVLFGLMGLVAFGAYGAMVIRTMASPWRLQLDPSELTLRTAYYDVHVPWERVVGIGVGEVSRRLGCVLEFDDVAAVVQGAAFHTRSGSPDAVVSAAKMQKRMEESHDLWGYHLGIPGRLLELGPEALAELLVQARSGALWQEPEKARRLGPG